ncbi:hypothetical protein F5Y17DRAFT_136962 [Xylariaceae sp. FL0594]|nr:hypothetical protein F5Y17DRAFT_136962 [Xylariaceae sp. FL0594]
MGVKRTSTIKNKHAAGKTSSKKSGGSSSEGRPKSSSSKPKSSASAPLGRQVKGAKLADLLKKKKKKVYTEKELGIPQLNTVTPIGVTKPKGKKKGKVFVDDKESMSTILAIVQADKEGQIESKMIKARQMEEIREARRAEAEKKEEEKKARLEETKDSLRKKRKRNQNKANDKEESISDAVQAGTNTKSAKKKKRVAFA